VKILFSTGKFRGTSDDFPDGTYDVEAWFELQRHEGPPDPTTWEGGGTTISSWRGDFQRLIDPRRIVMRCHGAKGVPDAVIPNEILDALPEDARLSFVWTVCTLTRTPAEAGRVATT
jgi:hypothetical protein